MGETKWWVESDQLYAQLYTELQQGHRYWFEDEENARIMQQNEPIRDLFSEWKRYDLKK